MTFIFRESYVFYLFLRLGVCVCVPAHMCLCNTDDTPAPVSGKLSTSVRQGFLLTLSSPISLDNRWQFWGSSCLCLPLSLVMFYGFLRAHLGPHACEPSTLQTKLYLQPRDCMCCKAEHGHTPEHCLAVRKHCVFRFVSIYYISHRKGSTIMHTPQGRKEHKSCGLGDRAHSTTSPLPILLYFH